MRFKLHRSRVITSLCGLSVEFIRGELTHVPPAMYAEVIAAGGVSEDEIPEGELPKKTNTPEALAEREAALFAAFEDIVTRNKREEFTAAGVPHGNVLAQKLGWTVQSKERDAAWVKFTAGKE